MSGIRRVSQLGTTGESTYVDGSIQAVDIADGAIGTADIAANAVTQAKLSTDIPLSGMRNVIINGDMRINQRGSSYTLSGNYTLDRWYLGVNTSHTVSQSTSSPPAGFQNFMRVQRTSGSTNTTVPQIAQSLETSASIPLQGKQVTVSFYARAGANYSATSNTFNWRIYGGTGTDQNIFSYTSQAIVVDQSVTLTTSWQRFSYTVSSLTSYNEYAFFFYYATTGTAGAADYVDITGVQIEVGSQPTPFEQRPIGVELALCQRYFWAMAVPSSVPGVMVSGYGNYCYMMLNTLNPVQMRIAPVAGVNPSYPLASYPPYIADFNSNLRTVTAVDMSSPLMVRWTYDSTKLTTGLILGLNYGDANRTLWLSSEL